MVEIMFLGGFDPVGGAAWIVIADEIREIGNDFEMWKWDAAFCIGKNGRADQVAGCEEDPTDEGDHGEIRQLRLPCLLWRG